MSDSLRPSESRNSSIIKPKRSLRGGFILATILVLIAFFVGFWARDIKQVVSEVFSSDQENNVINSHLSQDLDYSEVEALYDYLRLYFDGNLKEEDLLIGLKKGLFAATGDLYSEYYNAAEYQTFMSEVQGRLSGIGVLIGMHNHRITIISPISGSPADQAGLRSDDIIIEIDQQSTGHMTLTEASNLLRGEAGTKVDVTVYREKEDQNISATITRAIIEYPSVEYQVQDNIGVLELGYFAPEGSDAAGEYGTAGEILKASQNLLDAQVQGVVLDLRGNPGGDLQAAYEVAKLWLDSNEVVSHLAFGEQIRETFYVPQGGGQLAHLPLVVLVDHGSASASEIVAAALQDYKKATIIGETTFGKTSVQEVKLYQTGEGFKLTTNHWLSPNKRSLINGITPDLTLPDNLDTEEDEQLQEALRQIQQQILNLPERE